MTVLASPFLTVVTGTLVFIIGQICLKLIIEPYLEQQKIISEIRYSLIFYGNVSCSKEDVANEAKLKMTIEAQQKFRALAGQLSAVNMFVRGYGFWRFVLFAPSREKIKIASTGLIGLSNSLIAAPDTQIRHKYQQIIMDALEIKSSYIAID